MKLPKSYFYHLLREPMMLLNGRVYQLEENGDSSRDHIKVGNKAFKISEGDTVKFIEELYIKDFAREIDNFKTRFLNVGLKSYTKEKFISVQKTKRSLEQSRALQLILTKIIPAIEGENPTQNLEKYKSTVDEKEIEKYGENLSNIERGRLRKLENELDIKKLLLEEKYDIRIKNNDKSVLGQKILHNFNIVFLSYNEIWVVQKGQKNIKTDYLKLGGYTYSLKKYKEYPFWSKIEISYMKLLKMLLRIVALEEATIRIKEIEELNKQQAFLKKILVEGKFYGKKGGFYKTGANSYVFYMKFPQFINKFPRGGYYLFKEGEVMVSANYNYEKGDFNSPRSARVSGRYIHPFTDVVSGMGYSNLCMGEYRLPSDSYGYENIPQALLMAKNILMSGYHKGHSNPSRGVYTHIYTNRISKAKALKSGIPITNEKVIYKR